MGRFLVIEERSPLPRWLAKRVGAYLPPVVREEMVCGAEGSHLLYHELSSPRTRRKAAERICEAQTAGMVCGLIGSDDRYQAVQDMLDAPLADGRLLCTALRLAQIADETGDSTHITLLGADSALGQAAAGCLAMRVRYLAIDGRRKGLLDRLARRLWQTEGIAVRVGRGERGMLVSMDEISSPSDCMTADGRQISPVIAECALIAALPMLRGDGIITARTLAQTAEAAHFRGIKLLPKKDTRAVKFD